MQDFKEGDEVWFFYHHKTSDFWDDNLNAVYPGSLHVECGRIVEINETHDYVYVYVKGEQKLASFGQCFFYEYAFKSKPDALNAMRKRLDELENEMV